LAGIDIDYDKLLEKCNLVVMGDDQVLPSIVVFYALSH